MALNLALVATIRAETTATVMVVVSPAIIPVFATLIAAPGAEEIVKINSLYAANTLASGTVKVDAFLRSGSPAVDHYLCKTVSVSAGATTILITKDAPVYLKGSTHSLLVLSDVVGMTFVVSYELLS